MIAIYLQQGLGKSPLYSGLALVAWVAAFGLGGPLLRRLPPAGRRRAAMLGSAMMACAYFAFAACVIGGFHGDVWLIALLGIGGFGFGLATTALLGHLTSVVSGEAAAEMSGLYNTTSQVAAVVGIACFGNLYLGAATDQSRAFAIVCGAFGLSATFAAFAAHRAVSGVRQFA